MNAAHLTVYCVQCRTWSMALQAVGVCLAPGQGLATPAGSASPLVTFRARPAYRTPQARALRLRVAAMVRAARSTR